MITIWHLGKERVTLYSIEYSFKVRVMSAAEKPKSQHYHARAEECRSIAGMFHNDETRRKMLRVADDYDQMAANAEKTETEPRPRA